MPEELRENVVTEEKREVKQPTAKSAKKPAEDTVDPNKKVTEGQQKILLSTMDKSGVSAQALCEHFKIASVGELPFKDLNNALKFISDNKAEEAA